LVAGGGFADVHWLEAPLHIEAVRALQPLLALAPAEGRRRVAVLPEIDQASPGAANSLLKTLEEPPSRVVLVLTTAAVDAVLPTIRSRCRLFRLRPLPAATVATALTAHWDVAEDQALLLARLAGGRLGWAVRAVTQPELLAVRQGWLDSLAEVLAADRGRRLELAAGLAKGRDGNGVVEGLGIWSGWWRDLLLWHHGAETWLVNRDRLAELQAAAVRVSAPEALGAVGAVQAALRRLAVKANLQLTLEVLLLELPPCGAP
jgi:DNA polymerase-3 subunit delta'